MRRLLVALCLLTAALWSAPALAQARNQLGPLCTTDTTPPDQMIDACNKIVALKVFGDGQLATIYFYFWRAVGWNKKGDYTKVIADASEATRLQPSQAAYNLRGSAYYDRGEYDIAIADFDDALKLGPPSATITLIAFATAPGQVALDGEGANSPFSAALSRHIGTPGLEVQQMLTRVRAEVVSSTKNKQVPWSNSSLLGEVYLAEK
ncbi:caspase family protein [Bradyrhizobium neotropicale]|uniref:Peptidase C14 caspase domain-containing protein n=1 Tax=Bradyrhizobium neotropicale TaxID=1497615 RepID=A0A176ZIQ8_9BRAD|nr:caspase family protein [Bradyrhizobium neotropicale]OAF19782.1 hypothetical protein AXW67_35300 [Bradyrhizobium neotropicale]